LRLCVRLSVCVENKFHAKAQRREEEERAGRARVTNGRRPVSDRGTGRLARVFPAQYAKRTPPREQEQGKL
jgi:hypothetical protein